MSLAQSSYISGGIVDLAEASACAIFIWPHAEGSHNGSAAVLKTAGRKAMQVRVLSPPPFLFCNLRVFFLHQSFNRHPSPVATWRDLGALFGAGTFQTKRQWFLLQRINCRP